MPLSPSSVICCWPMGSDALLLRMWPQSWQKVMAAHHRVMAPVCWLPITGNSCSPLHSMYERGTAVVLYFSFVHLYAISSHALQWSTLFLKSDQSCSSFLRENFVAVTYIKSSPSVLWQRLIIIIIIIIRFVKCQNVKRLPWLRRVSTCRKNHSSSFLFCVQVNGGKLQKLQLKYFLHAHFNSWIDVSSVEVTKRKLEDTEDELKTLKRRHANNVKVVIVFNVLEFVILHLYWLCCPSAISQLPRCTC